MYDIVDCYFVSKNDSFLGIKIGTSKYIYSQKRRKIIDCPGFEEVFSEEFMDEDEILDER